MTTFVALVSVRKHQKKKLCALASWLVEQVLLLLFDAKFDQKYWCMGVRLFMTCL